MEADEPTQSDADYVSPGEGARMLGVTVRTLARYADEGKVEAIRPGSHRRYRRADIEALAS